MMDRLGAMFHRELAAARDFLRGNFRRKETPRRATPEEMAEVREAEERLKARGIKPGEGLISIAGPDGNPIEMKVTDFVFEEHRNPRDDAPIPVKRSMSYEVSVEKFNRSDFDLIFERYRDPHHSRVLRRTRRMKPTRTFPYIGYLRKPRQDIRAILSSHATRRIAMRRAEVKEARRLREIAASN